MVNIIVSIGDNDHASVFLLRRERSEVVKEEFQLLKKAEGVYRAEGVTLTINSGNATLDLEGMKYLAHQVQRRNNATTRSEIDQCLADNYIVWSNRHQVTRFDLRQDSICYFYKNSETEPYDKRRWYLISVADEYFLTFTDTSNEITQVKMRRGKMYLTSCQISHCREKEVSLLSK